MVTLSAPFTDQRSVDDWPDWIEDGSAWKNSTTGAAGLGGGGASAFGGGGGGGVGAFFLQPIANSIKKVANNTNTVDRLLI